MNTIERIAAWSYRRYSTYQECPRKAMYKFLDKLPEPGSPAMDRGTLIHKGIEDFLTGRDKTLPVEAKALAKEYRALKAKKPEVELELCFTSKWSPTGWFGKDAWYRSKIDILLPPVVGEGTVVILDNKTGKAKEPSFYDDQLELYGLAGLLAYPVAERAEAKMLFVDRGDIIECDPIPRKDVKKLQKKWVIKTKPMLSDTTFRPTPGNACRWCHFSKSKGGPCEF